MSVHDSRLTDSDLEAIGSAVDEYRLSVAQGLRAAGLPTRQLRPVELDVCERLAHQSIGCSAYDLREVELSTIRTVVDSRNRA